MGIPGLTSYIQRHVGESLDWHKLQNCHVVIDGSNLAFKLYDDIHKFGTAFGGDYDKYSTYVETIFGR